MEYWTDIITQRSWDVSAELRKRYRFILIGGWAVYLWTRALKSRDIDIILDFENLDKFKKQYTLTKNDNLKKYNAKINEIDIDIYVPYYSKLALPVENIMKETSSIEGFAVPIPEILLILKQGAEIERRHSEKGEKDRIDILQLLLKTDFNCKKYNELLKENKLENFRKELIFIVKNFKKIEYLNLNVVEYKKEKEIILKKIESD